MRKLLVGVVLAVVVLALLNRDVDNSEMYTSSDDNSWIVVDATAKTVTFSRVYDGKYYEDVGTYTDESDKESLVNYFMEVDMDNNYDR